MKKIVLVLLAAAILFSCRSTSKNTPGEEEHDGHDHAADLVLLTEQQKRALGLQTGTFLMRNLETSVKTNGQLEVPPAARAEVVAVMGGNVKEIRVFYGAKVRKGQVLAILTNPEYIVIQEDFSEIANKLEFLEKEYLRRKELYENNVGAGRDYQQVKSEYNTARVRFEGLKSRLQLLNLSPGNVLAGNISSTVAVTSPINGYVNNVNIRIGSYVSVSDILFGVTDNSRIHADFIVYENDVLLLKNGQKINFSVSNNKDDELTATIFAIGKEFESDTRSVHVHARLDEDPGGLIPGMYVSGYIHTDANDASTLPDDAVVREGTSAYIFVADNIPMSENHGDDHVEEEKQAAHSHNDRKDGSGSQGLAFRMTEVVPGRQDGGYTEIKLLSPLPKDAEIVISGAYYLMAELKKGEAEHSH